MQVCASIPRSSPRTDRLNGCEGEGHCQGQGIIGTRNSQGTVTAGTARVCKEAVHGNELGQGNEEMGEEGQEKGMQVEETIGYMRDRKEAEAHAVKTRLD